MRKFVILALVLGALGVSVAGGWVKAYGGSPIAWVKAYPGPTTY